VSAAGLPTAESAEQLRRAIDRLVGRVRHWTPNRWARTVPDGTMTRAARVHLLAQRLADAAAAAEGEPARRVPRLENDLALPDQVRVLAGDLLAVVEPRSAMLASMLTEVRATAAALD
jgi:hypothetical protein